MVEWREKKTRYCGGNVKTLEFTAFFEKKIIAFLAISYYNVLYKPIAQKAEWANYDRVKQKLRGTQIYGTRD